FHTAGREARTAASGMSAAIAAQQASVRAGQQFLATLREQSALFGKSTEDTLRYRAAQLSVGQAAAPLILQLQNQRAAHEQAAAAALREATAQREAAAAKRSAEAAQQSFINGLREQVALQGKSQTEVLRYR